MNVYVHVLAVQMQASEGRRWMLGSVMQRMLAACPKGRGKQSINSLTRQQNMPRALVLAHNTHISMLEAAQSTRQTSQHLPEYSNTYLAACSLVCPRPG